MREGFIQNEVTEAPRERTLQQCEELHDSAVEASENMRFNYGAVILLSLLVLSSVSYGCGSSSGHSPPTAPVSSPTEQTGPRWTIASDTSGPYVGRFHAADGTVLDAWRGDDGQLSSLHLSWTDGRQIQTRVDEVGRPLYFRDASGRQLWVNAYGSNDTVDVTLANPEGNQWRGLLQIPIGESEPSQLRSLNPLGIGRVAGEPATIGNRFCDKRFTSTLGLTLTAACLVVVAGTVLSGGISAPAFAPFFILTCAPTLPIPALLESQLCSYVSVAATTASEPSKVSIASLQALPNPIPAPPQLPVSTPLPPVNTHRLSVTKGGTGTGTVASSPAGVSCGSDCQENYTTGTVVTLTATAGSGSTFGGWGGDADCSDGSVTMSAARSCVAAFTLDSAPPPAPPVLSGIDVSPAGLGIHAVTQFGFVARGPTGPVSSDLLVAWDFAGRATATGVSAQHVFDRPGAYRVGVIVRDTFGQQVSGSTNINVGDVSGVWVGTVLNSPARLRLVQDGLKVSAILDQWERTNPGCVFTDNAAHTKWRSPRTLDVILESPDQGLCGGVYLEGTFDAALQVFEGTGAQQISLRRQ